MKLFDSLTKTKRELVPLRDGKVGVYTCGPTVYGRAHIGNFRTYLFEDVLKRTLLLLGYDVDHVMNITDVGHLTDDGNQGEDKMEKASSFEARSAFEIAESYTALFMEDSNRLNILPPAVICRATDHIREQIEQIELIIANGFAYVIEGDGVYFDTSLLEHYGLGPGNQRLLDHVVRHRIETKGKKNPADFALWKFSPADKRRQMEWESPWGIGFPGWHIECSAMATRYLGKLFDIHAGGIDHIPVHHSNELAQQQASYGTSLANLWVHSEFLTFGEGGEKMSKSNGGIISVSDLIDNSFDPLDFRYFTLTGHYRSQLKFTWESLSGAKAARQRLQRIIAGLDGSLASSGQVNAEYSERFQTALADDLNTAVALSVLWELLRDTKVPPAERKVTALCFDQVLGLNLDHQPEEIEVDAEVSELLLQRAEARRVKDWETADQLREKLQRMGFVVVDNGLTQTLKGVS